MNSFLYPAQVGFRMPAEWEQHQGTWLTWPRPDGISFPDRYDNIPTIYAELIRVLTESEHVFINVWDQQMEENVREILAKHKVPDTRVEFYHFPAYEPWCRDHGPIFIVCDSYNHRSRAVVDWDYNAWGGKYPPWDLDDRIPELVAEVRDLPLFKPGMILEGGAIDVNGVGALLTTKACLLNKNRNPQLTQGQIEQALKNYLGVKTIFWLEQGIEGDDTDGHVDDLARFVNPTTIVTVVEKDPTDPNYKPLLENLKILKSIRNLDGSRFRIVELPMPQPIMINDQRMPASYANFYISNKFVIVPTFGDPNDQLAIDVLQSVFPDRKVIGLNARDLIWGLGAFHCITQQEPAAKPGP